MACNILVDRFLGQPFVKRVFFILVSAAFPSVFIIISGFEDHCSVLECLGIVVLVEVV